MGVPTRPPRNKENDINGTLVGRTPSEVATHEADADPRPAPRTSTPVPGRGGLGGGPASDPRPSRTGGGLWAAQRATSRRVAHPAPPTTKGVGPDPGGHSLGQRVKSTVRISSVDKCVKRSRVVLLLVLLILLFLSGNRRGRSPSFPPQRHGGLTYCTLIGLLSKYYKRVYFRRKTFIRD